jgi:tRNA-dihydrouridine synthase B
MKIGSLVLDNITILAPLAGITNLPFRLLAKEAGCGLVCSEMISSNGLIRNSQKTFQMLDSLPQEKPLSTQIFGSDPAIMAEAAAIVESSGTDILDINLGCPVRKVLKTGSGAALMKDPEHVARLLKAVRRSINIPLTLKIRTGWDPSGDQALRIAQIAEDQGANAIAVHPRTAPQGFGGKAEWSIISAVKKAVSIPVIGNGDIICPEDAIRMKNETGCDAIMIGRATIGNPWIFSQVLALLRGERISPITLADRLEAMIRYLQASVQYLGEQRACAMMRSRLGWFAKGLPFSSKFRESIKHISSEKEATRIIHAYGNTLESELGKNSSGAPSRSIQ